jgi:hypothetical protein
MSIANILLGSGGPFLFIRTITTDQTDYNLYNQMVSAGWNGLTPVLVDLTINSGVVIGASANTVSAFTVNSVPSGSSIKITNNGAIVGRGGQGLGKSSSFYYGLPIPSYANGGTALTTAAAIRIDNTNGIIGGGGGGGGAGGGNGGGDCSCTGCGGGYANTGIMGAGGGGAGYGDAGYGATAYWASRQFFNFYYSTAGSATAGGSGYIYGGTGGSLGSDGTAGYGLGSCSSGYNYINLGTAGGTGGACTSGNSNITWLASGQRYGALN